MRSAFLEDESAFFGESVLKIEEFHRREQSIQAMRRQTGINVIKTFLLESKFTNFLREICQIFLAFRCI